MQSGTNLSGARGAPRLQALPLRFPLGGGLPRRRGLFEPAAGVLLRFLLQLPLAGPGAPEAVVALDPLRVEQVLPPLTPLLDRLRVGFALRQFTGGTAIQCTDLGLVVVAVAVALEHLGELVLPVVRDDLDVAVPRVIPPAPPPAVFPAAFAPVPFVAGAVDGHNLSSPESNCEYNNIFCREKIYYSNDVSIMRKPLQNLL